MKLGKVGILAIIVGSFGTLLGMGGMKSASMQLLEEAQKYLMGAPDGQAKQVLAEHVIGLAAQAKINEASDLIGATLGKKLPDSAVNAIDTELDDAKEFANNAKEKVSKKTSKSKPADIVSAVENLNNANNALINALEKFAQAYGKDKFNKLTSFSGSVGKMMEYVKKQYAEVKEIIKNLQIFDKKTSSYQLNSSLLYDALVKLTHFSFSNIIQELKSSK